MLERITASDYFGAMVASYDDFIRRAVPRYDEMIERLVRYLPPTASSVLELGCGTGNLSTALAERYSAADFTFVDASPEMLDATRARIGDAASRSRFVEQKFEQVDHTLGRFDLIVSSISLHHVVDKGALYAALRPMVNPEGTFRFADQLLGGTPDNHAVNWDGWLAFSRDEGRCTPEEIQSLLDHSAAHDHYTPVGEHFRLLEHAGFRNPDCVWRNWIWGIITADV